MFCVCVWFLQIKAIQLKLCSRTRQLASPTLDPAALAGNHDSMTLYNPHLLLNYNPSPTNINLEIYRSLNPTVFFVFFFDLDFRLHITSFLLIPETFFFPKMSCRETSQDERFCVDLFRSVPPTTIGLLSHVPQLLLLDDHHVSSVLSILLPSLGSSSSYYWNLNVRDEVARFMRIMFFCWVLFVFST